MLIIYDYNKVICPIKISLSPAGHTILRLSNMKEKRNVCKNTFEKKLFAKNYYHMANSILAKKRL